MIGILYRKEKYLSLNIINNDIICALKKEYDIISYKLMDNIEKDQVNIEKLYKKSDCVVNLSSKCINYTRNNYKPTIFLGHARMDHGAGINLYYNKKFIIKNDVITFASQSALKKYRYIYPRGITSFLLPYFTTVNKQKISLEEENILRKFYKIPLKKKIIVYFGRLNSEKNIEKVIALFDKLNRQDTCLLLIGNFSDEKTYGFGDQENIGEEYKKHILKLIATKKGDILLLTQIKRDILLKILYFSHIYINMTRCYEEDFGISTIEAMKLGLPAICSDRGGTKDLVIHKKTGFLVKTSIDNQYTIKFKNRDIIPYMTKILDDNILYKKISLEAKKRVKYLYSEEKFIKNIGKIIAFCSKNNKKNNTMKQKIIQPKIWIKKIYDKAIKYNQIKQIYFDNPDLYNIMYDFYISK